MGVRVPDRAGGPRVENHLVFERPAAPPPRIGGHWRVPFVARCCSPVTPATPPAGHLYNSLYTPDAAIAQCESPSDVQRCIAFAREHNVDIAARSGGHSYGAYSSCRGLVIDVSQMQDVSTGGAKALGQRVVTVGAGATLINVYSQLGAPGSPVAGRLMPDRRHRRTRPGRGNRRVLPCLRADVRPDGDGRVVTADGVVRQCGPGTQRGLYWASRGGGGGNFGIVTSFGFRVHPIPESITLFTLEWPWGAAASVLDAWLRWIPSTPDQLWANCQLFSSQNVGSGSVKVTGVFVGSVSACTAALNPLRVAVGEAATYSFVGPEDYLRASMIEAGCEGKSLAQCAVPVQSPFRAKSSYLGGPLSQETLSGIVSALSSLSDTLPGAGGASYSTATEG